MLKSEESSSSLSLEFSGPSSIAPHLAHSICPDAKTFTWWPYEVTWSSPAFAAIALQPGKGANMRSELVYSAGLQISNRFLLASIAMRAVRSLHINSARTEDTANRVLAEIATGRYVEVKVPELAPLPAIEPLLISPAA